MKQSTGFVPRKEALEAMSAAETVTAASSSGAGGASTSQTEDTSARSSSSSKQNHQENHGSSSQQQKHDEEHARSEDTNGKETSEQAATATTQGTDAKPSLHEYSGSGGVSGAGSTTRSSWGAGGTVSIAPVILQDVKHISFKGSHIACPRVRAITRLVVHSRRTIHSLRE